MSGSATILRSLQVPPALGFGAAGVKTLQGKVSSKCIHVDWWSPGDVVVPGDTSLHLTVDLVGLEDGPLLATPPPQVRSRLFQTGRGSPDDNRPSPCKGALCTRANSTNRKKCAHLHSTTLPIMQWKNNHFIMTVFNRPGVAGAVL